MTKTVALDTLRDQTPPKKTFAGMLEAMKPQLAAALPKHLNPERMVRVALTCYRMTPDLAKCDPMSVLAAVVQCAQLGLEPGLLGQAYLIPFKRNQKRPDGSWHSTYECQFIPGYKGLLSLARRSGEVTAISTEIVYDHDEFEMALGIEPSITHRPLLEGDRGKPRLVYGVARFRDGGYHFEWMPISAVNAIRARSKAANAGPWVTDYEQMARKTLIRRMANYLPMSVELAAALMADAAVGDGKRATYDGEVVQVHEDDPPTPAAVEHQPAADNELDESMRAGANPSQQAEPVSAGAAAAASAPSRRAAPKSAAGYPGFSME